MRPAERRSRWCWERPHGGVRCERDERRLLCVTYCSQANGAQRLAPAIDDARPRSPATGRPAAPLPDRTATMNRDVSTGPASLTGPELTGAPEPGSTSRMTTTAAPTPGTRTKVLLVDDHDLIRKGLRHAFERDRQFEVVGEAGDRGRGGPAGRRAPARRRDHGPAAARRQRPGGHPGPAQVQRHHGHRRADHVRGRRPALRRARGRASSAFVPEDRPGRRGRGGRPARRHRRRAPSPRPTWPRR